mgnify:FL=1
MINYYVQELSEQLGLDCFSIDILKSLKSIFFTKQPINEKGDDFLYHKLLKNNNDFKTKFNSRGNMPIHLYFNIKCFYDGYLFYAENYEWDFNEKIKPTKEKIDTSFLEKIPFLEYEVLNIKIKYNNKWKRLIQTKNCIIIL